MLVGSIVYFIVAYLERIGNRWASAISSPAATGMRKNGLQLQIIRNKKPLRQDDAGQVRRIPMERTSCFGVKEVGIS